MKEIKIFQTAIFLLIIVFLVSALIPFFTGSEKPMIVLSGSMTPIMLPGDMVIIRSVDPNDLVVGDVIAFKDPGDKPNSFITHRIISLEEGKERIFQTKGDANNVEDDFKVPASDVVGRLTFVIPFVGYLPEISKNNHIFLLTIIMPASLLVIEEIRNLILYSNPARARKFEIEQKKMARRIYYMIKGKRLAAIILITGLISTGIVIPNLGTNGSIILERENTIENFRSLPMVYVFTPEDSGQRIAINSWYGVVTPDNETQVIAPENTPSTISSVPYVLPVFWVVRLAEISPYFPAIVEVGLYTFISTLLLIPLWYQKSSIGKKSKKIKLRRLVAQWKMAFHLE